MKLQTIFALIVFPLAGCGGADFTSAPVPGCGDAACEDSGQGAQDGGLAEAAQDSNAPGQDADPGRDGATGHDSGGCVPSASACAVGAPGKDQCSLTNDCRLVDDGCGGKISCGECGAHAQCMNGLCVGCLRNPARDFACAVGQAFACEGAPIPSGCQQMVGQCTTCCP